MFFNRCHKSFLSKACLASLLCGSRSNVDSLYASESHLSRFIEFFKTRFPEVVNEAEVTASNGFHAIRSVFIDAENGVALAQKADLIEV